MRPLAAFTKVRSEKYDIFSSVSLTHSGTRNFTFHRGRMASAAMKALMKRFKEAPKTGCRS